MGNSLNSGVLLGLGALGFVLLALSALGSFQIYTMLRRFLSERLAENQDATQRLSGVVREALHAPIVDLTERFTKSNAETKDHLSERLNQNFAITQERLDRSLIKTTEALEGRFRALEGQVSERLDTIRQNVETRLSENMKEGFKHFEKVQEHLKAAELKLAGLAVVGQSISDLNSLLKLPHLRGGFGEATLERLLADFLPQGAYELQACVVPGSSERVDAVVKLAQRALPIDSKFPREHVLPLFESQDPVALEGARSALSDYVRTQAKSISEKYIRPEHGTTDMALLFVPSETLYFEIIRNGKLFETITKMKVFPVSPNTLSISLHSIAMAQEYYEMARGVEKTIEEIRKARKHFESFESRFGEIGRGLKKAQEAYETASTHLGRYESSIFRLMGEAQQALPPSTGLGLE